MFPHSLIIWTLDPQLVALFAKIKELSGSGNLLEGVYHWHLWVYSLSLLHVLSLTPVWEIGLARHLLLWPCLPGLWPYGGFYPSGTLTPLRCLCQCSISASWTELTLALHFHSHSSFDGHRGCFWISAILSRAVMNMDATVVASRVRILAQGWWVRLTQYISLQMFRSQQAAFHWGCTTGRFQQQCMRLPP